MKRKAISLLLALAAFLSILPVSSWAEDGKPEEHVHKRQLLEIMVNYGGKIEHCGKFYCEECGETYEASIVSEDINGMPILDIRGSLDGISKENKVIVDVTYRSPERSFFSFATLKIQGATSASFPKKNYTIQFFEPYKSKTKIKLVDEWGKQSKYCLKANWVDFSQARNVVSGRLFSQVVHSRDIDDELAALPNGGVVDGFPVLVYLHGRYQGLYTLNIPKDKWMFDMSDKAPRQALMFADNWSDSTGLYKTISDIHDLAADNWDLEYCSTEHVFKVGPDWAVESMNEFIRFLINNNGEKFINGIEKYTDVDRVIDVLIYTYFIYAADNVSKNILWATYDGTKWIPSIYDLDGTWGMKWDGSFVYEPDDMPPAGDNLLFYRLMKHYMPEITARYAELRGGVLSQENITAVFTDFFAQIPDVVYAAEKNKWRTVPGQEENTLQQILDFADARISYLDDWFGVTITEPHNRHDQASLRS